MHTYNYSNYYLPFDSGVYTFYPAGSSGPIVIQVVIAWVAGWGVGQQDVSMVQHLLLHQKQGKKSHR